MDTTLARPARTIRFKFAAKKAVAAIHWLVKQLPGIDLHTMLKTCYIADKDQLNVWNQPIFGATYRAMRFGPVPLEIYEIAKGENLWMAELGITTVPWRLDGYKLYLISNEEPDMSSFSDDDLQALTRAFTLCKSMTFDARTALTHGPDWQAAELGIMRYEDMLNDSPDKLDRIEYLVASAPYMAL